LEKIKIDMDAVSKYEIIFSKNLTIELIEEFFLIKVLANLLKIISLK
jgi:hypothetical protein